MICLICRKAEIHTELVSINFERDDFKTLIRLVPALVCPACGEAYLNEQVTTQLLSQVESLYEEGLTQLEADFA